MRYGFIHLSSPVTRCHHHRQGSAPSFSNSSQTGGGGGSGVCTEELDVDEPLLDDDELPLDDELPDDDDDDVLSSSLSTSFFARRGLSLTPPRRGLSLMPRASIVYAGRRRMVGMGMGAVRLSCPSMFCAAVEAQGSSKHLGAGPWGWARWLGRPASLERSSVRGNGLRRLSCCSDELRLPASILPDASLRLCSFALTALVQQ